MKIPQLKISLGILSILFLAALSFLVFNPVGYLKMSQVKKDLNRLNSQIDSLRRENDVLRGMKDSLTKNDPSKLDRTAREKFDMHKPNETVIKIEEK